MATIKGGDKLRAALENIGKALREKPTLEVGFMDGATYPDGTSVALVAALNEFGTAHSPPRPFFRRAIAKNQKKWAKNLAAELKRSNYDVTRSLEKLGAEIVGEIQESITELVSPPLKPSTIKRKGFSKPLVETKQMLFSPTFRIKS